jgi:hypothetical protein
LNGISVPFASWCIANGLVVAVAAAAHVAVFVTRPEREERPLVHAVIGSVRRVRSREAGGCNRQQGQRECDGEGPASLRTHSCCLRRRRCSTGTRRSVSPAGRR